MSQQNEVSSLSYVQIEHCHIPGSLAVLSGWDVMSAPCSKTLSQKTRGIDFWKDGYLFIAKIMVKITNEERINKSLWKKTPTGEKEK